MSIGNTMYQKSEKINSKFDFQASVSINGDKRS